jgi:hypothetical protein
MGWYATAVFCFHESDGTFLLRACPVQASSEAEAVGLIYAATTEDRPGSRGWSVPHVVAARVPDPGPPVPDPGGGIRLKLSSHAVSMIVEMASRTGRDFEGALVDALNAYKILVDGPEDYPGDFPEDGPGGSPEGFS